MYEGEPRGWARVPGTPSPVLPACRQTRASPSPLTYISPWPPYSTQRKAPMRVDLVGNGKCFAWMQSSRRKTGALTGWGPRHHGETVMAGAWGGETHGRLLAGSGRQWLTRQSSQSRPSLQHGSNAWVVGFYVMVLPRGWFALAFEDFSKRKGRGKCGHCPCLPADRAMLSVFLAGLCP